MEYQMRPVSPIMHAGISTWSVRVRWDRYLTSKCAELDSRGLQLGPDIKVRKMTSRRRRTYKCLSMDLNRQHALSGYCCMLMSNKRHCRLVLRRICQFHTSLYLCCASYKGYATAGPGNKKRKTSASTYVSFVLHSLQFSFF